MKVHIYRVTDGKIVRTVTCPPDHVVQQCRPGEEFFLNCPDGSTHIVDGQPVQIKEPPPPDGQVMSKIRDRRNELLTRTDWTQMSDSPLAPAKKKAWAAYRQALRDFPETCNLADPVWPEPPNNN